ncbi:proline-rich protein 36-like isoform X1 [Ammospiza nelsoni]|uniref:proline-rich protein 36-like isoform X1 n=1 Tax=Ammospiza nelsoni TaxID=2857394 RepID=UPI00286B9D2E|nr:proline-rich protein 36-like isoform X1 [Ammospiza nelsoni]
MGVGSPAPAGLLDPAPLRDGVALVPEAAPERSETALPAPAPVLLGDTLGDNSDSAPPPRAIPHPPASPPAPMLLSNSDAPPPLLPAPALPVLAPLLPVRTPTETATAPPQRTPESAAEDGADPVPCLPPLSEPRDTAVACACASPPPQTETVLVQDGAENGAEPAGPSKQPTAVPTPSVISRPSVSGCPGAAPAGAAGTGEEGVSRSFREAGTARHLGAARLPAFKISILGGLGSVWSVAAPWRLPSLPPLLCPSGEGQVGSAESSAFGLQPSGGGAMRQMGDTPDAFALQRQGAQREAIMACLLWGTNIPRSEMRIFGAASISLLLACLSGFGERKRLTTRAAIVLAAGCRPVGMQSLPRGFGLGCWAQEVPGPGPLPGLLMTVGVVVSPTGPGPPFVGQLWGSWSVHGPGPPRAFSFSGSALLLLLLLFSITNKQTKKPQIFKLNKED